ncbi:hypothetical protein A7K72_10020 [Candidatus Methylacidiphilum fumarolicum]|nr:hypothetical protein A7K72_10020 [Candidatus Methylacidiphilum fumarolicum]
MPWIIKTLQNFYQTRKKSYRRLQVSLLSKNHDTAPIRRLWILVALCVSQKLGHGRKDDFAWQLRDIPFD